jgi:hypothetical protein
MGHKCSPLPGQGRNGITLCLTPEEGRGISAKLQVSERSEDPGCLPKYHAP